MTAPTYKRVCQVIGTLAGIDPEKIAPAQALGPSPTPNFYWHNAVKGALEPTPIDLDSLDRVALAMQLEDEFGITITDDEVDDHALNHVGGLVAFVQGKLDAKPRTYGDLLPALAA